MLASKILFSLIRMKNACVNTTLVEIVATFAALYSTSMNGTLEILLTVHPVNHVNAMDMQIFVYTTKKFMPKNCP